MIRTTTRPAARNHSRYLALGLAATLALPLLASGPAHATGNFPSPSGNTSTASILTYADTVRELERIEQNSRYGVDVFTLAEAGTAVDTSEQGRDLYVATVGDGPQDIWVQGRIHGNEPYGAESILSLLKDLGTNGSPQYDEIRDAFTIHFIPMYNPDGSELNIRQTVLWDTAADAPRTDAAGNNLIVDLNRDWVAGKFQARESLAFYEYWTMVDPDYGIDIHHQGLKQQFGTGDDVTLSLGISLAPGGPTLPTLQGGAYDVLTRQMHGYVYEELKGNGYITMDRYQVNGSQEIDIKGGVVSAMMLGLNYQGLNPEGHSNPVVFFETSGNTSDGSLGQKARGKSIRQNIEAMRTLLTGLANGEVQQTDPEIWEEIPHAPVTAYSTDYAGTLPVSVTP